MTCNDITQYFSLAEGHLYMEDVIALGAAVCQQTSKLEMQTWIKTMRPQLHMAKLAVDIRISARFILATISNFI